MMTLREQLQRDEGLRLHPYADTQGKLTIGYGRNLTDTGLALAEAEYLLDRDIARVTAELTAVASWIGSVDEIRRAALLNLAFNLGVHGLLEFRNMIAAVRIPDWDRAAAELLDSEYARQLPARAHRVAEQLRTGEWM